MKKENWKRCKHQEIHREEGSHAPIQDDNHLEPSDF